MKVRGEIAVVFTVVFWRYLGSGAFLGIGWGEYGCGRGEVVILFIVFGGR